MFNFVVLLKSKAAAISPAGAVSKYCNEHVCVSVCLPNFVVHIVYGRDSVLLRQDDEIPMGTGLFSGFLPIDSALCSIGREVWVGFHRAVQNKTATLATESKKVTNSL